MGPDGSGNGGVGGSAGLFGAGGTGGASATNFGGAGGHGGWFLGSNGTAGSGAPTNATIGLNLVLGTEPVTMLSVNGGPSVPVLVDTGSNGLVMPLKDVGLQHLGLPTGLGTGGYSGGLAYVYVKFHTTVDFGGGVVTQPTDVNVVVFSLPKSFASFMSGNGADGVLGIGPNATGPNTSNPVQRCRATSTRVCSSTNPAITWCLAPTRALPLEPRFFLLTERRSHPWGYRSTAGLSHKASPPLSTPVVCTEPSRHQ